MQTITRKLGSGYAPDVTANAKREGNNQSWMPELQGRKLRFVNTTHEYRRRIGLVIRSLFHKTKVSFAWCNTQVRAL